MGFLNKIESIVNIANTATDIATKIKANDLLSGINLSNVNINNIDGIQSQIEGVINRKVNELTSNIENSVDMSQIESIANSIDLSDFDIPGIEGLEGITFQ